MEITSKIIIQKIEKIFVGVFTRHPFYDTMELLQMSRLREGSSL